MKKILYILPSLVFVLYFLFTIRFALFNNLTGVFSSNPEPVVYQELNSFLQNDPSFFRTLWVPDIQRFGSLSNIHPEVSGSYLLGTSDLQKQLQILTRPQEEKVLQEAGIKYLIIPYDSEGELFVKKRTYNDALYEQTVSKIKKVPYLHIYKTFGKIIVLLLPQPKDRFWSPNSSLKISYATINPTEYVAHINASTSGKLVFSEMYDQNWVIIDKNNFTITPSKPFDSAFNSFSLPKGNYDVIIYFQLQQFIWMGLLVSIGTFCALIGLFVFTFYMRK